jgi:hypothetical protein
MSVATSTGKVDASGGRAAELELQPLATQLLCRTVEMDHRMLAPNADIPKPCFQRRSAVSGIAKSRREQPAWLRQPHVTCGH